MKSWCGGCVHEPQARHQRKARNVQGEGRMQGGMNGVEGGWEGEGWARTDEARSTQQRPLASKDLAVLLFGDCSDYCVDVGAAKKGSGGDEQRRATFTDLDPGQLLAHSRDVVATRVCSLLRARQHSLICITTSAGLETQAK